MHGLLAELHGPPNGAGAGEHAVARAAIGGVGNAKGGADAGLGSGQGGGALQNGGELLDVAGGDT